jgi:hypothetical protein
VAAIIIRSIEKVTAKQGSVVPQGVGQGLGVRQSSKAAIVNEEAYEFAFINTSKQAQKSASTGFVKVKVRVDKS